MSKARFAWSGAVTVALAALAVACSRNPPPPPAPAPAPTADAGVAVRADAGKPKEPPKYRTDAKKSFVDPAVTASSKKYMVASEQAVATKVGRDVLAAGGNAVDAAVATAFALAVVHPTAGNIGGGGFAIVRTGPGKASALDFREVAPAAATEHMYLDPAGNPTKDSLVGHRAAGVPGSVAGLFELHKKHGKKPWKDVVAPAIALARDGFSIDQVLAGSIARRKDALAKFPETAAIWLPGGTPLAAGATAKIPALATTLERIAAKGPDGFYKGETAAAIVAEMKVGGGIMTAEDLAAYKPVWREPLRVSYRGNAMFAMPPPSSGGIVLAMAAGMLGASELGKLPWHDVEHVHRLVEVWRRAFAARNELLGDPAFIKDMPVAKLLAPDYLTKLNASIEQNATPSANVAGLLEGTHTTNLCVVDAAGMAVAMTTTINTSWGSGVTVKDAGFLLNNEMDDFTAKPGAPNAFGLVQGTANKIEPGKRMLSSMSPTIVENAKGEVILLAGAGGGPRIITAVWQTLSNVIDFNQKLEAAVANPRIHHQHLPDVVFVEAESIDQATAQALEARHYALDWSPYSADLAHITAIARTTTGWDGTADPRNGGGAMGD